MVRSASTSASSSTNSRRHSMSGVSRQQIPMRCFWMRSSMRIPRGSPTIRHRRFLYVLTNFNHGPHHRQLVPPGQFERERAFAMASLPDAGYAEYYTRLAETASTWQKLKARLASSFPGRPVLIVHYGDHQPVLTKQIDRQLKAAGRCAARVWHVLCDRSLEYPAPQPRTGRRPRYRLSRNCCFATGGYCARPDICYARELA